MQYITPLVDFDVVTLERTSSAERFTSTVCSVMSDIQFVWCTQTALSLFTTTLAFACSYCVSYRSRDAGCGAGPSLGTSVCVNIGERESALLWRVSLPFAESEWCVSVCNSQHYGIARRSHAVGTLLFRAVSSNAVYANHRLRGTKMNDLFSIFI